MVNRLDEILSKFVAVFLLPIINLICIGTIVYWSSKANISAVSEKLFSLNGVSDGGVGLASQFVKNNFEFIKSTIETYRNEIEKLSYFVAATTSVLTVLAIYLFDRLVFHFGVLIPPNFEFDVEAYAEAAARGRPSEIASFRKALNAIWGPGVTCTFPQAYWVVRAYLGEKNSDPQRLAFRSRLLKGLDATNVVIGYVKSYVVIAIALFIASLLSRSPLSVLGALEALIFLTIVMAAAVYYFALCYRRLVDYDIGSFVWEQSYKDQTKFKRRILSALFEPQRIAQRGLRLGCCNLRITCLSRDDV